MGKIINFVNSCKKCKYSTKLGGCTNKKYIENCYKIVEKGRCPYFEMKEENKND